MISEKELDEMSESRASSPKEAFCYRLGFRAAEKIYLAKIAKLEARIKKLTNLNELLFYIEKNARNMVASEYNDLWKRINELKNEGDKFTFCSCTHPAYCICKNEGEK